MSAASVTVTQFTDPMCTWCWGSEPVVRRLQTVYGSQIEFEYVMGGLIEDFEEFYDAANDISEPGEVGPHWVEASERHGMPVDTEIFDTDPAHSTYPASRAFVAARQQGRELGQQYLRRLREAYATEVRNVNHREEQVALAASVGLDTEAFTAALDDGTAEAGFEADLARTREAGVRAFPTYHVRGPEGVRRLDGFQSVEEMVAALSAVDPSLTAADPPGIEQFVAEAGPVATQEVATVAGLTHGKARQALGSLADEGVVRREQRGNGSFWRFGGGEN